MLIHLDGEKRVPDIIYWSQNIARKLFHGKTLNKQQIYALEEMQNNHYNIIKSYRSGGLTTLMLIKIAYDVLYRHVYEPDSIQYITNCYASAKDALNHFMKILDYCDEKIYYKIKDFNVELKTDNNNSCKIHFTYFRTKEIGFEKVFDDIYIDNASTIEFDDTFKELILTHCFYRNVNIGGLAVKKDSLFFRIWDESLKHKNHFKQISLKWYIDPRFNKDLKAIDKNGETKDVENIGMILDALENGYEITNYWREGHKRMYNNDISHSIDGKFRD